jgi:proline-specific peptidase
MEETMMTNGFINSNGLKLYYEIEGEGHAVVLLSGGPGLSHEYLQPLRALASDAQLVFFDQRGTGRSDKANLQDYTVEANVEDVEQLRRELQLDSFILFGHSWGGMLAQAYALKYPAHVSKLILADTFSSVTELNLSLMRMRNAAPEATRAIYDRYEQEGLYKDRDRYPDEYQAGLEIAYEPVFISVPPPEYLQDVFSKLAYDVYRVMWGEESEFKVTGTLAQFDVTHRLPEIRVPTLVIVSTSDIPTVAMAQQTAQLIPDAQLEVFEHSRHFPFIEEPETFFNVIRQFIQDKPQPHMGAT